MFATLIKIKNSKIHDQQLKLTRSSIKNKLFEISKEFKNLNLNNMYVQNLLRKMKFSRIKYLLTQGLIQKKIEFRGINIDETLDTQYSPLSSKVELWT